MWMIVLGIIDALYVLAMIGMALYGFSNIVSVVLYLRSKKRSNRRSQNAEMDEWPFVTVQLPIFNERYTVERLLNAVRKLDYPHQRLQIQVLDDSTDDTTELIRRLVNSIAATDIDIELIHRVDRSGFKAGALAEGTQTAKGSLIAIFDADFVPPSNWLKKTVPEFQDQHLGCLQTRWGHLNDKFNHFTMAQSLAIDAHFLVEQTARSHSGLFMNFNGTAGLWRKTCIEDAGGWQADTLTEDLDLSYRAQMRGWRFSYLPEVVVPAELPAQIEAFKRQQFRWAKGGFQVFRKQAIAILRSHNPWYKRLLGILHITGYFVHPLMVVALLLMLPVGYFTPQVWHWTPWTLITTFGPPMLCLVAASERLPRLIDRLRLMPMLLLIGFGLSFSNSVATFEGLFKKGSGTFVRTPKFNLHNRKRTWTDSTYTISISPTVWGELALALYALVVSVILFPQRGWLVLPWLFIYGAGYLYIAGANLSQTIQVYRIQTGMTASASIH